MKNNLSVTSRILVAFASGALVAVFFLPVWRIDLFAPQYPEGLTMNIWINGLSGDVDVINGLNHYIGMKHITVAMFPEFHYLPYVVGLFMLLGMTVAITGRRKLLMVYLTLTVIGGIAAMYDFYKWGYDYGHNLDPKAPIQVPGLSYQPPLFGHKRLLNFDAYSFPHIGGWIVVAAAALAFAVWFAEWYHARKVKIKGGVPRIAIAATTLTLFYITGCAIRTEPISYGKDSCDFCRMTIMDPKFGGEILTKKGRVYKFDDEVCLAKFLHSNALKPEAIAKQVLIDFSKGGGWIDTKTAWLVTSADLKSPMGGNTAAFASEADARAFLNGRQGEVRNWRQFTSATK